MSFFWICDEQLAVFNKHRRGLAEAAEKDALGPARFFTSHLGCIDRAKLDLQWFLERFTRFFECIGSAKGIAATVSADLAVFVNGQRNRSHYRIRHVVLDQQPRQIPVADDGLCLDRQAKDETKNKYG